MKLQEIQDQIEEDSKIDSNKLDWESLRIASLHAKYLRIYGEEMRTLKAMQFNYFTLKKERVDYYMGRAEDEIYVSEPLNFKILKTDIDLYIDSDEKLNAVKGSMEMQKVKVEIVEKFLSTLQNRGYGIKTALDYMKFKAGEY